MNAPEGARPHNQLDQCLIAQGNWMPNNRVPTGTVVPTDSVRIRRLKRG